jgi:hypothetical protein
LKPAFGGVPFSGAAERGNPAMQKRIVFTALKRRRQGLVPGYPPRCVNAQVVQTLGDPECRRIKISSAWAPPSG